MLYFAERGRTLSARNEEVWSWVQLGKVFEIEPTADVGELYLFVLEYRGNARPLSVRVGETLFEVAPAPELQGQYVWRRVKLPARVLAQPEVVVTVSCTAPAMSAWVVALDTTGHRGASFKSMDRGRTWRTDCMGYDFTLSGEYLIRLWTPGEGPRHPHLPFIHEVRDHPRLEELRAMLTASMGALPSGTDFDCARELMSWLAAQWDHQGGWLGSAYAPWEAASILDWGKRGEGHGLRGLDAFCVHYAVAFVQFATALGLDARMVFCEGTGRGLGNGHCVPEVFCREREKWIVFDPDADAIPSLDGEPLGAMELHELAFSPRAGDMVLLPGPNHAKRPAELQAFWKRLWPKVLFRRWGFLPRNDFFSHPEAFPCEHGRSDYHCVDILWYDSARLAPNRWYPYYSSDDADFLYHGE